MHPPHAPRRLVAFLACASAACSAAHAQFYTFNSTIEGWQVYNINVNGEPLTSLPASSPSLPSFDAVTGLPAGSLRVIDLVGETWIGRPLSGNFEHLFGAGELSFDVYYRFRDNAAYSAAGIIGGGLALWVSMPPPTLNSWLHWSFPLTPGAWRVGTINGPLATPAQIAIVLNDVRGIAIHTEWNTGADDTNVDNILFGVPTICPPACNLADITSVGGTSEDPGCPDQQLTVDDLIVFINFFIAQTNCPGAAPCNRADVAGVGGNGNPPDGELTVDDLIEFVNAFSAGC